MLHTDEPTHYQTALLLRLRLLNRNQVQRGTRELLEALRTNHSLSATTAAPEFGRETEVGRDSRYLRIRNFSKPMLFRVQAPLHLGTEETG